MANRTLVVSTLSGRSISLPVVARPSAPSSFNATLRLARHTSLLPSTSRPALSDANSGLTSSQDETLQSSDCENKQSRGRRRSRRPRKEDETDPNASAKKDGIKVELPIAFVAAQAGREIAVIGAEMTTAAITSASSAGKAALGELAESTIRDSVTQAAIGSRSSVQASSSQIAAKAVLGVNPSVNNGAAHQIVQNAVGATGASVASAGTGLVAAAAVAAGIAGASSLINKAALSATISMAAAAASKNGEGATATEDPFARLAKELAKGKAEKTVGPNNFLSDLNGKEGEKDPFTEGDCPTCNGFGIVRCDLCRGQGVVTWEAKFDHDDPCPKCLTRRYIICPTCEGASAKGRKHHLFAHLQGIWQKGVHDDDIPLTDE